MKFLPYALRRLAFLVPQILGILLVTFVLVRLLPGDPARLMAGPLMPEAGVELIREKMGLTGSLPVQFIHYVQRVVHGDLGTSWYTGNPVMTDIAMRLPITVELIVLSLLVTFLIMLPMGIKAVSLGGSLAKKVAGRAFFMYGMAAGAFPDFWLALILVFVFYAVLGWAPAPAGILDVGMARPTHITGMYLADSLLTGNWATFVSSLKHWILPVFTLAFVYGGGIVKVAMITAIGVQKAGFINFAKVSGLSPSTIQRYVTRLVYPSVATYTAVVFAFLIGGVVLIEKVFSLGGFGQYAVQAITMTDYAAIQGVVLISALINLAVFIIVDMTYFWLDPRIRALA